MTDAVNSPSTLSASTLDLGELDGTLLVFGGVDGNLDALDALLKQAAMQGIPFTRMIHTGGVAPFCSEPIEVAARLAEIGIASVRGTFEIDAPLIMQDGLADELPETSADGWRSILEEGIPADITAWMEGLPSQLLFTLGDRRFRVVHSTLSSPEKLLFASSPAPGFLSELALSGTDVVIGGRSGLPFTRLFTAAQETQLWHNPGALGMPANDGTPRVWFSLIHPTPGGLKFEHRPLTYDHRSAAAKLRQVNSDNAVAKCLASGLWPSLEDVPQGERSRRGLPLDPRSFTLATTENIEET